MTELSRFWNGTAIGDAAVEAPYDGNTEFSKVLLAIAGADNDPNKGGVWYSDLGELAPTNPASTTVRIASGRAMVWGTWYENDGNVDTTPAAPAASTRIDRYVLRKDWAAQTVRITRIAGVEGGGAPALVQSVGTTWDYPICQASTTTGGAVTITDERTFIGGGAYAPSDAAFALFGSNSNLSNEVDLQSMQLINEVMGFPAYVAPDADLVTLNLWFEDLSTPTTKCTFVDVAGEAGITETYEHALKCTGDSSGDGFYQRLTYADQPRVKSGRKLSGLFAVWAPAGRIVTIALTTSTPTTVSAATTTTAAWEVVKVENLTLDGTYVDWKASIDGAGTFYVVPLGICIGPKALPLPPRPWRYVDRPVGAWDVNGVDPGGAAADWDLTSISSPIAFMGNVVVTYQNTGAAGALIVRRKGDTTSNRGTSRNPQASATFLSAGLALIPMDDAQTINYLTDQAAGATEAVFLSLCGWFEWG